jgi:UDP-N-acetyl-D-mannosaminuronate dehydrogenase
MASRSSGCPISAPRGPGRAPGTIAANRRYLQRGHLNPNRTAITQAFSGCAGYLRDGQLLIFRSTVLPGVTALVEKITRAADMPSAGFAAGPCLFKDIVQLAAFNHNNFPLGHAAMAVNEGLPLYVVHRLEQQRCSPTASQPNRF